MTPSTAPTPDKPGRWVISEFGVPSVLKWQTWDPLPSATGDQILIAIITAGISGADNFMRVGGYPDPRCEKPGFTPGYDFCGEIEAVGPDVPASLHLSKGDRVASMCVVGAYATHILLPAGEVVKVEKTDDPVAICALPLNYMTAYGMLKRSDAELKKGDSILIGSVSGGVGTALAQLVHTFDMGLTMYGTCSAAKFDFVKSLGVTPIDRHANVPERVRALTGGKMVDVAYDAVGSAESLTASHASVKADTGRLVSIGVMSNIAPDGSKVLDTKYNVFQELQRFPRASFFGVTHFYYYPKKELFLSDLALIVKAVRDGRLKPSIGKLLPLRDAVVANEMLVHGGGVMGKMEFVVREDLAKAKGVV
ncbi:MAG: hypothetical protein M1826_006185 [Phylliscum demangeonii]|nr:MAG: hypothetical protein M1826_006185 [Phylliscum demangeonii]